MSRKRSGTEGREVHCVKIYRERVNTEMERRGERETVRITQSERNRERERRTRKKEREGD